MKPVSRGHALYWVRILAVAWVMGGIFLSFPALAPADSLLDISTRSQVTDDGRVTITLTLRNPGSQPLFHLHPMFHFHHTMSHMAMIHRLDPGESITLDNSMHPPVRSAGSYPVVAMVSFKETARALESRTRVHTGSFHFGEPRVSLIEGNIGTEVKEDTSRIRVLLKNPSTSFKNIRMMLLLPPELIADRFQGMMGFTIRGGEEKYFEVPVRKVSGLPGGVYPVHLLVEYGEMLKHYSGEIRGEINFGPVVVSTNFWPQMLVFVFLAVTLGWVLYRKLRVSKVI